MITIFVLVALTGLTFANPLDLQPREDVKEDQFDLCRLLGCHRPHTVTRTLVYTITSTATSSATATATITTTLDCSPSASTTLRTTATTSDFTSTGTSATTATSPDTTASIDTTSTNTAAPTDFTTSTDITTSTDTTSADTAAPTDITTSTDTTSADTTPAPTTLTDSSSDVSGSTGATTFTGRTTSTNTTLTGVTTSSDITIPTHTASTTDATTSPDTTTSTEAATSGTTTAEARDTTTAAASTSSSSSSTTDLLSPLSTLVPFNCSADAFFIQDRLLLSVNLQTGERKTLSSRVGGSSARVSAISFNTLDNFIYGLQNETVVRVGHDGALQRVAEGDMAANAGDVDSNGQLYYTAGGRDWARVDLKPGSARYGQVVARGTSDSSALPGNLAAGDWAFTPAAPGYLHSVAVGADGRVYLVRWDLATHRWEVRHEGLPGFGIQGSVFGAVVATSDGVLYASHNGSGAVLRIPLDDPKGTRKVKVRVPTAGFSDGCRCASRPDVAV